MIDLNDERLLEVAYNDGINGISEDVCELFRKLIKGDIKNGEFKSRNYI